MHNLQEKANETLMKYEIPHIQDEELGFVSQDIKIQKIYEKGKFLRNYRLYLNTIGGILFIVAIMLYYNLFEECPFKTDSQCAKEWLIPRVPKLILMVSFSSSIFVLIVLMAVKKYISRLYIGLFILFLTEMIFFEDHVMSTTNYQILYQIFEILFIVIISLIIFIFSSCFKCYKRWGLKCFISVIFIIIAILIYSQAKINNSCIDWKKGLNGESIIQSGNYCQVVEPSVCWYDIFDGLMDASKIYDCTLDSKDINPIWIQQLNSSIPIPEDTKYIEMPRTEYFSERQRFQSYLQFQQYFFTQMKFLKNLKDISDQAETYLDLQQMKYITKIKRNETLIEQRLQNYTKTKSKINGRNLPKNIITIFIDAVSRARYMKKLKKSTEWFGQKALDLQDTHQMFQAFRYMSVGITTTPNFYGYEYGIVNVPEYDKTRWTTTNGYENPNLDSNGNPILHTQDKPKYESVTQTLQEAGYIIAKSRTICGSSIKEHEPEDAAFIKAQPIDHEFVSSSCDPNYMSPKSPFGILYGPYSILRKCLYGQEINQYVFNYGKEFITTYYDVPKYLELYFLDGHEGTGDAINHFDDPLNNFLNWLFENNHHKDSLIMMVSDHGLHMQGLYYLMKTSIYDIELALPGLFLLIDKNLIDEREQQALKENQQKVVTSFEVYYTLNFFTSDAPNIVKNSLFSSIIPEGRGCRDIPTRKDQFCGCIKQK